MGASRQYENEEAVFKYDRQYSARLGVEEKCMYRSWRSVKYDLLKFAL